MKQTFGEDLRTFRAGEIQARAAAAVRDTEGGQMIRTLASKFNRAIADLRSAGWGVAAMTAGGRSANDDEIAISAVRGEPRVYFEIGSSNPAAVPLSVSLKISGADAFAQWLDAGCPLPAPLFSPALPPGTYVRVSAAALVLDGSDRVLLVQHRDRGWELPGGSLRPGEDFLEAAVRETVEETGLELLFPEGPSVRFSGDRLEAVGIVRGSASGDPWIRAEEGSLVAARWFSRPEVRELSLSPLPSSVELEAWLELMQPGIFVMAEGSASGRLLVHRTPSGWQVPTGEIEPGETLDAAVRRIVGSVAPDVQIPADTFSFYRSGRDFVVRFDGSGLAIGPAVWRERTDLRRDELSPVSRLLVSQWASAPFEGGPDLEPRCPVCNDTGDASAVPEACIGETDRCGVCPPPGAPSPWQAAAVRLDALETLEALLRDAEAVPSGREILAECLRLARMLLEKNRAYGDSALSPLRIFSRGLSPEAGLLVRLDDKLSRLARGQGEDLEDVEGDAAGYLVLLRVLRRRLRAEKGGENG